MVNSEKKKIYIPEVITVKSLAEKTNLPVTAVISELMKNGVLATINETIDFDTASIVAEYLGVEIALEEEDSSKIEPVLPRPVSTGKNLSIRPPVVTIMGHVDHGKTTLLDNIRSSSVVKSESGGITQHISAYQVTLANSKNKNLKNRVVTFIDTPGHAAFSAIRGHGAAITDIAIIIVAATDGVMPQTLEVINQAKSQNVPIIVAINKVDLPDADIIKTKQQLSEHDLVPEDWGGKTVMVEVSAKTGKGIDDLLEMILLQADMMELKADPTQNATGIVIESHMEKGAGPLATVLIDNGTLHKGDPISIGSSFGKVRILQDYAGKTIVNASPSMPVRIAGLRSLPEFGDRLCVFESEKEARDTASKSAQSYSKVRIANAKKIVSDEETAEIKSDFHIVLKCDVGGSLEAIKKTIDEIDKTYVDLKIVLEGVGDISESDVDLAEASGALVVGFRVKILGSAKRIADKEGIKVRVFDIIYELIDYIKQEISDTLPPEIIEEVLGEGKVLAIFRDDRKGFVTGGRVDSGKITVGDEIKFFQDNPPAGGEKFRAKVISLRREKSEAKECESGAECGFGLPAGAKVSVGDDFVVFKTIEKKRTIR